MTPAEKRKQTMIKKLGGEQAYLDHFKKAGAKGGKAPTGSFLTVPGLAKKASDLGLKKRYVK